MEIKALLLTIAWGASNKGNYTTHEVYSRYKDIKQLLEAEEKTERLKKK